MRSRPPVRRVARALRHAFGRDPMRLPSARTWHRAVLRLANYGRAHECPICRAHVRSFVPFGHPRRRRAKCPVCGSMEWHRLGWLAVERLLAEHRGPARVLQVAPEREIGRRFRSHPDVHHVSADLAAGRAAVAADLEHLPFPAGAFDVVYCSHVLEHVHDDLSAMHELRRVISASGVAVVLVPVTADHTWGDPSITDPARRTQLFGQDDHVRVYGMDVVGRLASCGWDVEVHPVEELGSHAIERYGLPDGEVARPAGDVFTCRPVVVARSAP